MLKPDDVEPYKIDIDKYKEQNLLVDKYNQWLEEHNKNSICRLRDTHKVFLSFLHDNGYTLIKL